MRPLFVFTGLEAQPWWKALRDLEQELERRDRQGVLSEYGTLVATLARGRHASLETAVAAALLEGEELLTRDVDGLPAGLAEAALFDLETVAGVLEEEWQDRAEKVARTELPPLAELAPSNGELEGWARKLVDGEPEEYLQSLIERYRTCGTGLLARHLAYRWDGERLTGIERPAIERMEELVDLERQLGRLTGNVERFLSGAPALHTLLYGPRGSGKSTAVRSLLSRYAGDGLRLVQVPPESLGRLSDLALQLSGGPHRYVAFVDDLSFEPGDVSYRPLRTILEGSLAQQPDNLLIIATSNRRHLVREGFSARPDPLDDDVHRWDTVHEQLALADRFGLHITFPSTDQRDYLRLVREIAKTRGLTIAAEQLEREALLFAEWGNGYSGRTARQFVDSIS